MRIGFGCDHTAVELKKTLMRHLEEQGHDCIDYGTKEEGVRMDYPIPGRRVAEAIIAGEAEKGVLICGTGIGISLAANKVPGIRAAVCSEPYSARMTVRHNDANIIAMGARVVSTGIAEMIVDEFFRAEYEGGRHENRIDMIREIEKEYSIKERV